jgi:hypothetical protein
MIIWSSQKLERAFAQGKLTPWSKVKYLILPAVISSLFGPAYVIKPRYGSRPPGFNMLFSLFFAVLTAYLTYRGIRGCLRQNDQIDGKAFFERFVVLGVPPMFRLAAIIIPLSVGMMIIFAQFPQYPVLRVRGPIAVAALSPLATYAFYAMLRNSIRRFGEMKKTEELEGS